MHVSGRVSLISVLCASAVCCLLAADAALGQSSGGPASGSPEVVASEPAARADDRQGKHRELESVLGREIHTRVEEGVGRIVDLLADRSGKVQAAVIEFGGFLGIGTRKIAVEWSALSFSAEGKQPQIILDMTRDQIRRAPEYKVNEPAIVRRVEN
jgi:hypothetical protein